MEYVRKYVNILKQNFCNEMKLFFYNKASSFFTSLAILLIIHASDRSVWTKSEKEICFSMINRFGIEGMYGGSFIFDLEVLSNLLLELCLYMTYAFFYSFSDAKEIFWTYFQICR